MWIIFISSKFRFLSTKYDSQRKWRSAAMRISPALSAKMKKGKKHTANGHAKNGNYPMGRKRFDNEYLIFKRFIMKRIEIHSLISLFIRPSYFWHRRGWRRGRWLFSGFVGFFKNSLFWCIWFSFWWEKYEPRKCFRKASRCDWSKTR